MLQRNFNFIYSLLFLFPLLLISQETTLVDLKNVYPDRVEVAGFTLTTEQEITIEAAAIKPYTSDRYRPFTDAWILNSDNRDIVWVLNDLDSRDRDRNIAYYGDQIKLEPGHYEVYYSSFINRYEGGWWNGPSHYRPGFFERIFGGVFDEGGWGFSHRDYSELFIKVTGSGQAQSKDVVNQWHDEYKKSAIIDFTAMRDERFSEQLFEVSKTMDVKIYAIGEARDDGEFDFGWIMDLETREKVWDLTYRHSAHAGGSPKNRLSEEIITLDPGKYKIVYVTDDSHSYRRWNSAPPYDPSFWGIALWAVNEQDKGSITLIEPEDINEKNIIVKFDRVRDEEYLSAGFTVKKPLNFHVYAMGEGSEGDMYDYGWIINVKTREKVWIMKYRDTENAGGAQKNRLFDGIITLEPGNYMAYYVTDGSHSFRRWNSSAPYNQESWGMRISVLDENFSEGDVTEYNEADDESVLVRINRVGDRDRARAKFQLDQDQEVHVYAIGEGVGNNMYDYAWIENANTGSVVWEMSYRQTERAGGARKNRLYDGTIKLKAGEYEVFYETDDSHSFADWNDSPPHDPINWGITITRLDK